MGRGRPSRVWRIRSRAVFERLFQEGRRVRRGPLSVTFVACGPEGPPMVAYAIGRKVGGAVQRNRLRRRLRAVVADRAQTMRPGAYLVSATPGATALSFGELRALLTRAVEAAAQSGPDGP